MKAKLLYRHKIEDDEGNIQQIIIWELPPKTPDRLHRIKYRCYYGNASGQCIVRYDNESGKGDHNHIGDKEVPYEFMTVEQLMRDFIQDIDQLSHQEK